MLGLIFIFFFSFLVSFLLTYFLAFVLKNLHIGQFVRQEGPQEHKSKQGTPTFGGAVVIFAMLLSSFIFVDLDNKLGILLLCTVGFAIIGFIDDYLKVMNKNNDALKPNQKLIMQFLFSLIFSIVLLLDFHDSTVSGLLKKFGFNLPWLYLPFMVLLLMGSSNATNLTDGLDGLLAGTSFFAFLSFAFISYRLGQGDILGLCVICAGAMLGFLLLNFHPAKIFLGDVGSLSIGFLLGAIAILLHKELMWILIGGVFVLETLSVILQVTSYKLFKRRIFKMSPLHHHFELSGMNEKNVVFLFWIIAFIFAVLGAVL